MKFKDADLIGIPLRVTIGAKGLAAGNVELKPRTEADPKKAELVPVADAARVLAERVRRARAAGRRVARVERLPPPPAVPGALAARSPCAGEVEAHGRGGALEARVHVPARRGARSSSATRTPSTAAACTAPCPSRSRRRSPTRRATSWRGRASTSAASARAQGTYDDGRGEVDDARAVHRRTCARSRPACPSRCAGTPSARGSGCARRPRRDGGRRARAARRAEHALLRALGRRARRFAGPKTIFLGDQDEFCDVDEGRALAAQPRRRAARLRGLRPPLH